jgi:hypothetical protein
MCLPGRHLVTDETPWRLVRATLTPSGEWYYDRFSQSAVLCCPEHPLGPNED